MDGDLLAGRVSEGHIDLYIFNEQAGGLLLCGWVAGEVAGRLRIGDYTARFPGQDRRGAGFPGFYVREGLGGRGIGVVLFIACERPPAGPLLWLRCGGGDDADVVTPTKRACTADSGEAARVLLPLLGRITPSLPEPIVHALRGADLPAADAVLWHVDEVIATPPGGAVLAGWCLARPGAIRALRLRSSGASVPIDLAAAVRVPRPEVLQAAGQAEGFDELRCGFVIFVPGGYDAVGTTLVDIDTPNGILSRTLPQPRLEGAAAIRHLLGAFDAQFDDLRHAFDSVLGPAVSRLRAAHPAARGGDHIMKFGAASARRPDGLLRIGYFGALGRAQGVGVLLEAARLLDEAGDRVVRIALHGEISPQPEERAAIEALLGAASGRVTCLHAGDPATVAARMRGMDAIVVPSDWWEPAPVAIALARQCRVPVLCGDIGAIAECVRDGIDGFHFVAGSPESLADLLLALAALPYRLTELGMRPDPQRDESDAEAALADHVAHSLSRDPGTGKNY